MALAQPFLAAKKSLQARQQNGEFKRFRQIVVSARGEALQNIFRTSPGSQHQDGDILPGGPQLGGYREAVLSGKHYVEHDGIERLLLGALRFMIFAGEQQIESTLAVAHDLHRVPFGLQVELQALGEMSFVFDNQNAAHATLRGSSMTTVVPRPSPSLAAKTRPPCLRATARTINNPRPVPLTLLKVRPGTR